MKDRTPDNVLGIISTHDDIDQGYEALITLRGNFPRRKFDLVTVRYEQWIHTSDRYAIVEYVYGT